MRIPVLEHMSSGLRIRLACAGLQLDHHSIPAHVVLVYMASSVFGLWILVFVRGSLPFGPWRILPRFVRSSASDAHLQPPLFRSGSSGGGGAVASFPELVL